MIVVPCSLICVTLMIIRILYTIRMFSMALGSRIVCTSMVSVRLRSCVCVCVGGGGGGVAS